MELEEYIKNHPEFNKLRKDFTKFLKKKNLEYSLDFSDCRFEKDDIHFEVKIYTKKKEKKKKKLLKMTLKEFLNFFDLSNLGGFQIYIDENAEQHYKDTFIRHYTFKDFLYANKIDYDSDRHIVKLESGDIKIIDWNPKFEFYIIFIWDEEKEMYKSYNHCFFEKEDAENFIKEMQNGILG